MIKLEIPIPEPKIRELRVGDTVLLSGLVVTARDAGHKLMVEERPRFLDDLLREGVIYHCGPVVKQEGERWSFVAAGPTTSAREEPYQAKVIESYQVRGVIGKGGMGKKTTEAMDKYGAVYGAFTGGAAVLAANAVKNVKDVAWLDLGMPEAMWILEVEDFGPLVVAIDSFGKNLYRDVAEKVEQNKRGIFRSFGFSN